MKTIQPQRVKDANYQDVAEQLRHIFYVIIFKPVNQIMRKFTHQKLGAKKALLNALQNSLRDALILGSVQYTNGIFSGQFSGAIGRDLRALGATFDRRNKVYRLNAVSVPSWIIALAAAANANSRQAHELLSVKLGEMQRDLDALVGVHTIDPSEAVDSIESDFNKLAGSLMVQPKLSAESRSRLESDYRDNMKLWIKKFSSETITQLRESVAKNAEKGYRFDRLIKDIQSRYGVTHNKAKFLARQESSLYMSKYRRERFSEAGVTHYKWSTSHDARVRHDHRALDGLTFEYNHPPIVASLPRVRRGNPGEDYNCRCVDIALLEAA